MATSENPSFMQMESVLTALGCIAQVLPEKAAVQLRSVVASVVVKQVSIDCGLYRVFQKPRPHLEIDYLGNY